MFASPVNLHIVNVLEVVFIFLGLFGAALFVDKPRFRGLVLLLLLQSALMLFNFLEETRISYDIHLITPAFTLAIGPVFFLFVFHLVYPNIAWNLSEIKHALPALIGLGFTQWPHWVIAFGSVSIFIYSFRSYQVLRQYHKANVALASDANSTQLGWLQKLFILLAILVCIDVIRINAQPILQEELAHTWYFFNQLGFFCITLVLVFRAARQPDLFDATGIFEQELEPNPSVQVAEQQSPLPPPSEAELNLFTQINNVVSEEQLYLIPRYSLTDLAERLGLGLKDVSSAINRGANCNFNDYINRLRINEVKAQLSLKKDKSILEIALASGFNSKSSFNQAFKKEMGITPSAYMKMHQSNKKPSK